MCQRIVALVACAWFLLPADHASGQDLEPRRWTPMPAGMEVLGAGFGVTRGDVFFDPALQIEDAELEAQTIALSYVHAFRLGGRLARFDVVVPWQNIRYEGLLEGMPATTARVGLMDTAFRLSVILAGARPDPAAKAQTVIGAALMVVAPFGEYDGAKLINLGQNRWVFRPQAGIVHTRGRWSWELTGSAYFYTDNNDFYGNVTREQDPLLELQGHIVYSLPRQGHWLSLSAGYGGNGNSIINGNRVDDDMRQMLTSLSWGMPLGKAQSLKLAYLRSRTNVNRGSDTDTLAVAWSMRF